jgi:hypothetical protein
MIARSIAVIVSGSVVPVVDERNVVEKVVMLPVTFRSPMMMIDESPKT